jgi:hypothetical protein
MLGTAFRFSSRGARGEDNGWGWSVAARGQNMDGLLKAALWWIVFLHHEKSALNRFLAGS